MSYQVLARKWRPKNFQQLMGQEHVVSVLSNALAQDRLHHAYLFTGTRGVGKTTIARIFAKSLNCDKGITNTPCGQCDTCIDIDQGRFVDLLEIDAASKTKVDDTREILDNVQYAPSRGRFKVYLIDEVHMLSRHSFNALLKTLEEPPEHVKFILATTDPQKLPITVLSRCLQFHLKALTVNQIEEKLSEILLQEKVTYEQGCLTLLAKAARGSMRDSLSLTDQAIAQGMGNISLANIQQMLGGIDQHWVYQLVIALLKQDSQSLMVLSQEIASYAPSYSRLFAELIQLFHQIALLQIVDQHFDLPADLLSLLKKFSQAMSAEDVQLYYQISLNGRKDLPYASDEQAAFDMTLLRLLAFKPMQKSKLTVDSAKEFAQQVPAVNFNEINVPEARIATNTAEHTSINEVQEQSKPTSGLTDSISSQSLTIKEFNSIDSLVSPAIEELNQVELNAEMVGIEQQAAVQHGMGNDSNINPKQSAALRHVDQVQTEIVQVESVQVDNVVAPVDDNQLHVNDEQPRSSKIEDDTKLLAIDSPVGSVLATRNMLRSRKKILEGQTKKSSDASQRQSSNTEKVTSENEALQKQTSPQSVVLAPEPEVPFHQDNIDPATIIKANQVDKWAHMIDSMQLTARIRQLAIHATISEDSTDDNLILQLDQATRHLNTEFAQEQLQDSICEFLSKKITVTLNIVEETVADPYQIQGQINDKRLDYAKTLIKEDNVVIALQETFQASLDEASISPR
jgi:DNA polymerase-3 subunit gamma/tau